MSSELFSLIVKCWHDARTDAAQLGVTRVETGEELHFKDGAFLFRFFSDADSSIQRCMIRHMASGREAYIQSGQEMQEFVKSCLLQIGDDNT